MKLKVNGEMVEHDVAYLSQLLETMALPERGVAVAVNNTMISREEWKNYSEDHEDLYEIWRENGKPETFSESIDKRTTPMFILDDKGKTIINPEISEYESE